MDAIQVEVFEFAIVIVTALVGWVTKHVVTYLKQKGIITKLENNKALVKIAVEAVEQSYKALHGKEKIDLAKIELVKLANEKGVKISEKEIDLLIESTVKEMNDTLKEEFKK